MQLLYKVLSIGYFIIATLGLMMIALLMLIGAVWEVVASFGTSGHIEAVLDGAGLLIIGFAIVETAKFVAEEEILRKRELRSPVESRMSLTKFITIIVIAASLEALVMIFKASRENIADSVYPAVLFGVAMLALVGLGLYQWLSSRIAPPTETERQQSEEVAKELE